MKKQLTITLLDLYKVFKKYPELKNKIKVQTRFGFKEIEECDITAYNSEVYEIKTELGKKLLTSPEHLLYSKELKWTKVQDLTLNSKIFTIDGLESIKTLKKLKSRKDLYDIQVKDVHEFYANGIVSHNSSIVSSIVYALYGQTPNNVKNSSIYNRFTNSKELYVSLIFEIDDKTYKVISSTNKYGNPACRLLEIQDNNEIDLTKSTISETRKFIANELLHCDIDLFLRTILLTSDNTYNFFKLSKYDKRQFIEQLFDISDFGLIYNEIHKKLLLLEKEINLKQNTLLNLNKNKDNYKKLLEKHEVQKKQQIESLLKDLNTLNIQYEKTKNITINDNNGEIQKYNNALNKIININNTLNTEITSINQEINNLKLKIHTLLTTNKNNVKIINKHNDLLVKLCNDCKNIFREYYDLNTYQQDIENNNITINSLNTELENKNNKYKQLSDKKIDIEEKINKINKKIKLLTDEITKVNFQLTDIEHKIKYKNKELENIKNNINPYNTLLNTTETEIDNEEKILLSIIDEYNHIEYAQNIVSPDSIRKIVIKELISTLNNRIKYYLTKIGSKFDTIFDENMNYTFLTEGGECEYGSFSSGEKMRINLATSFAFRDFLAFRSNLTSNILILDEVIDSNLDSMAIENIVEILKEFIVQYNNAIYLISHRKEVDNSIFNEIIQVVKQNNISTITYL